MSARTTTRKAPPKSGRGKRSPAVPSAPLKLPERGEPMVDIETILDEADPALSNTQGGTSTPPDHAERAPPNTSTPPSAVDSELSLQEHLHLVQRDLHRGMEISGGELRMRQTPAIPPPTPASNAATLSTNPAIHESNAEIIGGTPAASNVKGNPAQTEAGGDRLVASASANVVANTSSAASPKNSLIRQSSVDLQNLPRDLASMISEMPWEDLIRMWKEDREARAQLSNDRVVSNHSVVIDEMDRIVANEISKRSRETNDRPVAVPPKTNVKVSPSPSPFAYGPLGNRPTPKLGSLDQARKAKNLVVFNPSTSKARNWLTNFMSICVANELTDRQRVILFHECMDENPRALFDAKFKIATTSMSAVTEWFLTTYPSPANRMHAQRVLKDCSWDLNRPAEQFIADFNHCFIHHPECDKQTKILALLEKLPPTMRAQAELQLDRLAFYEAITQWVVDHEDLKRVDMPRPPMAVNSMQVRRTDPMQEENYNQTAHNTPAFTDVRRQLSLPDMVAVLRDSGACFKCGKTGHIARYCYSAVHGHRAPRGRGRVMRGGLNNKFQNANQNSSYWSDSDAQHRQGIKHKRDDY